MTLSPLTPYIIGKSEFQPPYLIKIDVQGYEAKVLASASALLQKPCLIIAEFWPYGLRVAGSPISEFAALVAEHNLTVYEISEERVALRRADLADVGRALSDQRFDDSRDLVLTNMPLHLTGLSQYLLPRHPSLVPVDSENRQLCRRRNPKAAFAISSCAISAGIGRGWSLRSSPASS